MQSANADDTFLWVALVCEELKNPETQIWNTLDLFRMFPSGLKPLYTRIMDRILSSRIARNVKVCKELLAIALIVYRPIASEELKILVESLGQDHLHHLPTIIKACGSSLSLRKGVLYFVHQSAKDSLLDKESEKILPTGAAHQHHAIFSKSLKVLSKTLEHDLCNLGAPGFPIDQVSPRHLAAAISCCPIFVVSSQNQCMCSGWQAPISGPSASLFLTHRTSGWNWK